MSNGCPVNHDSKGVEDKLNPLTNMPYATRLKDGQDNEQLSQHRQVSTIPRTMPDGPVGPSKETDGQSKAEENTSFWMYPSSQMFYSAMKRKGHDTEAADVDAIVAIHNSLNEGVWQQILDWESSKLGVCPRPTLKRFRGRPMDLSPLARWNHYVWGAELPFDRHDWIIDRCGTEVRYIIDYYEGRPDVDGYPTMHTQVRPALDSLQAAWDRLKQLF